MSCSFYIFVQLKVSTDTVQRHYAPGKNFHFQIRGDPGAKVSLVAVDNSVYLLNGERLTQRKACLYFYSLIKSKEGGMYILYVHLEYAVMLQVSML